MDDSRVWNGSGCIAGCLLSMTMFFPGFLWAAETGNPLSADGTTHGSHTEPRIGLGGLIDELEAANPEIKAARQRWEAAKAVVPQVQTLPDPKLQLGYQRMPMVPPVVEGAMYGFGQDIPFPGKLRLRGEVAERDAERLEQEYQATRLRLIAALKEAYYSLHFVHKSIEIVGSNKALLMQFEKTAKARYSVGQAAQQDVFRAQVEISRVLDRLAVLDQQMESLHAAINRLLNRPPAGPLGTPEEIHTTILTVPLHELNRRADELSPALRASAKGIDRSERSVSLAKRQYFPDFDVQALGLRNDRINDNGYQVIVGIKIPLFYESKQKQGVREALAGLEGAREDFTATRQDLLFQVKDGFVQAQRAERLITILRDAIIPQATLALQAAQAGYAVGKVDFLTLLNSLLTLQDSQLELHGEMVSHERALARLEALTGGSLNAPLPQRTSR
ncbi:putative chemiosmotic efflux system B protein C [Nitrospira moscoviensis]|uniref:Putative chemiosmotic efflux system B protein C n=2 Tax=Nitrospira moscoviensis TaxID=42253 RepID=A0A0K2GBM1_NITMO|nr:putative chemiosmotic efflux system B protein C [Nitrospira moscoviensis]